MISEIVSAKKALNRCVDHFNSINSSDTDELEYAYNQLEMCEDEVVRLNEQYAVELAQIDKMWAQRGVHGGWCKLSS